ncbi:RNase P, subunit Pop3 [Lipomyces arxii]|uniref:RNase P, subunit Pop3 n=1 Tax=Lipomyces arxii TaxID=56418 RepID=UPI0034D00F48
MSSKRKDQSPARRTVFRPVLDNPHTRVIWPEITPEDGKLFVELLCELLKPLATYKASKSKSKDAKPDRPNFLHSVTLGFNPTTSCLQRQVSEIYSQKSYCVQTRLQTVPKRTHKSKPIVAVFVARSDITPPILVSHFPLLCSSSATPVKLIQLPKLSMVKLSEAAGSELGIIGIKKDCPGADMIFSILARVDDIEIPWVKAGKVSYESLKIKALTTTMPIGTEKDKAKPVGEEKS